jgi:PhzF family phenazine biosynthesis protein
VIQEVFQINAFAPEPFAGNPAIVCPLETWLDDGLMQRIAAESGRTCAFFVGRTGRYELRWFSPRAEIEGICGHGTLAAGFVILNELGDTGEEVSFRVSAGKLRVSRRDGLYVLDLPALAPTRYASPGNLRETLGREPDVLLGALDLIAVFAAEEDVADFTPNPTAIADLPLRALIVTAPGRNIDFVSRWFGPTGEDAGITGSAQCSLVPYWADRLGKTRLKARQLAPRGGTMDCELHDDRVLLSCTAVKYMQGHLYL